MSKKYTKEEFEEALAESESIADVIRYLNLNVNRQHYEEVKYSATQWGLELPVWDQTKSTQWANLKNTISDDDWFQPGTRRTGKDSKKRLYRSGVKEECAECGLGPEWNGKPITLQLDHIDGDRFNNAKENLQILCPNCHAQTETFGNKGATKKYNYCQDCNGLIAKDSERCWACEAKNRTGKLKIDYPPLDVIVCMIQESNMSKASEKIGCTDTALRKHLKRNGIDWKSKPL